MHCSDYRKKIRVLCTVHHGFISSSSPHQRRPPHQPQTAAENNSLRRQPWIVSIRTTPESQLHQPRPPTNHRSQHHHLRQQHHAPTGPRSAETPATPQHSPSLAPLGPIAEAQAELTTVVREEEGRKQNSSARQEEEGKSF